MEYEKTMKFMNKKTDLNVAGMVKDIEIHAGGNLPLESIYFLKENRMRTVEA